jgi:two-component system cell cycle sensor histidine kinase/response regulator CckA
VPARRAAKGRLLLVEDEPGVRAFAARALRLHGHEVEEAASDEGALERLADPGYAPDLILTDVILPDLDGPTWVRQALLSRPGTRVVFMSDYAEDSFAEQKALIEGSGFLPKPFSLSELTQMVERQLAPPDARQPIPRDATRSPRAPRCRPPRRPLRTAP